MPFSVEDLILDSRPITCSINESAEVVLDRMHEFDFSQLPILDGEDNLLGLATKDSILEALAHFQVPLSALRVSDCITKRRVFRTDDDLFELLDALRDSYAVLVVGSNGKLKGIVTNYDAMSYFRRRAEDAMLVEDIETTIKDLIRRRFSENDTLDQEALDAAITSISPSDRELKKRFAQAVRALGGTDGINLNDDVLTEAVTILSPPQPSKSFERLSLNEFIELFLHKTSWGFYSESVGVPSDAVRRLLISVKNSRNALAHFRGEITQKERMQLRYCQGWLSGILPDMESQNGGLPEDSPDKSLETTNNDFDVREGENIDVVDVKELKEGRYSGLAALLGTVPKSRDLCTLSFQRIEEAIGSSLPSSARQYRAWWANDPVGRPHSRQWLDTGWRVSSASTKGEEVTFTRTEESEQAYIEFFGLMLSEISESATFPVSTPSQDGRRYVAIAGLPSEGPRIASITLSFSRYSQFRIELYIDKGGPEQNKKLYDELFRRRGEIETSLGHPLNWERLDSRLASRIALYRRGAITDSVEELSELRKWVIEWLPKFYKAMEDAVGIARRQ